MFSGVNSSLNKGATIQLPGGGCFLELDKLIILPPMCRTADCFSTLIKNIIDIDLGYDEQCILVKLEHYLKNSEIGHAIDMLHSVKVNFANKIIQICIFTEEGVLRTSGVHGAPSMVPPWKLNYPCCPRQSPYFSESWIHHQKTHFTQSHLANSLGCNHQISF